MAADAGAKKYATATASRMPTVKRKFFVESNFFIGQKWRFC
jgi:hypothetical protein